MLLNIKALAALERVLDVLIKFSFTAEACFNQTLIIFIIHSHVNEVSYKCLTYFIPNRHVETEVAVEELMMLVMELRVRLPWLPPLGLEVDARVVDDTVVVHVDSHSVERHWKYVKNNL